MPIFEYTCKDCHNTFQMLELPGNAKQEPLCPACGQGNIQKLISTPFIPSAVGKPANGELHGGSCCSTKGKDSNGCSSPGSCCGKAAGE